MDRFDYAEKINELLDNACGQLSNDDFEMLLSVVDDIVQNYD